MSLEKVSAVADSREVPALVEVGSSRHRPASSCTRSESAGTDRRMKGLVRVES